MDFYRKCDRLIRFFYTIMILSDDKKKQNLKEQAKKIMQKHLEVLVADFGKKEVCIQDEGEKVTLFFTAEVFSHEGKIGINIYEKTLGEKNPVLFLNYRNDLTDIADILFDADGIIRYDIWKIMSENIASAFFTSPKKRVLHAL